MYQTSHPTSYNWEFDDKFDAFVLTIKSLSNTILDKNT